jgi:transposase
MLPPGLFPPATTVQRWFYRFRDTGLWRAINHRLAKDFERTIESATAWIFLASVQFITRKIARR